MTRTRLDGIHLLFLGAVIFLAMGLVLQYATPKTTADFRLVYFSARCLLEGKDPYQPKELEGMYYSEGGESAATAPDRRSEPRFTYLPTAFPLTMPFALLPFGPAHVLWLGFIASSFILASILIWDVASAFDPLVASALVALILATSELLLILGNPAGPAISLCVIAVWCFLRERCVTAGIICLALSLMLKPHDAALVWLYFVLAGRQNRKRACLTLLAVVVVSLPAVLWTSAAAPGWTQEFRRNMRSLSAHGDVSDPGPAGDASHGIGMVTDMQAALSLIRDEPHFYNAVAYLIFGVLFCVWTVKTLRTPFSQSMAWFALAPISILSIIAIYHRVYDARLILLTMPACMMLWKEGGPAARVAVALEATGIFVTGAVPWAIFLQIIRHLHVSSDFGREFLIVAQVVPIPLVMLALGVFYLYVYVRRGTDAETGPTIALPAEGSGGGKGICV